MPDSANETWRLIHTWDAEPGWQMALDEALLENASAPPTLRFYTWKPDALSLGWFQRYEDVPATGAATRVVRRLTGGGAIHHAGELTFSITAAADHPLYAGPVADSYERVHAILIGAFAQFGLESELRGPDALATDRLETGLCFQHSSAQDIVWGGRKGVGSAQRRKAGRVLHHGSIKLATTAIDATVGTLSRAGRELAPAELAERLGTAFERALGIRLAPGQPTREELAHATRRAAFFEADEHVRRR